jgi:hypothetical protein
VTSSAGTTWLSTSCTARGVVPTGPPPLRQGPVQVMPSGGAGPWGVRRGNRPRLTGGPRPGLRRRGAAPGRWSGAERARRGSSGPAPMSGLRARSGVRLDGAPPQRQHHQDDEHDQQQSAKPDFHAGSRTPVPSDHPASAQSRHTVSRLTRRRRIRHPALPGVAAGGRSTRIRVDDPEQYAARCRDRAGEGAVPRPPQASSAADFGKVRVRLHSQVETQSSDEAVCVRGEPCVPANGGGGAGLEPGSRLRAMTASASSGTRLG